MISLFLFRSNARGLQYGIGTYISELTQSLLAIPDINTYIVSYKSNDCKEFSVRIRSDRITEVAIPSPLFPSAQNNTFDKRYASSVVRLLSDLISGNGEVFFQINYIDDLPIAIKLKEYFNHPVISIVHFAQWQQIFDGNRKKLAGLNIDKPSNNIEFTLSQERAMYLVSDHIISVTRYMKDFLVNEYGIDSVKITVIPNGLDYNKYRTISEKNRFDLRKRLGFGKDEIIILFSGRIDPCKGIFYLIEAFEEACKKNSDLRLVLLGQGNIQDCQRKLQSSFGKVTYTGFLTRDLVTSFYQVADIGIAPSVYDHCPYTVLEMMANRIPLIASRINGLDELLDDNSCLFVDPVVSEEGNITFNIKELSEAIVTLSKDHDIREKMAIRAYKLFKEKFLSARMAEEMNNLFLSLTDCNKITAHYEEIERR
jgi:glycosyltransferase involved in cell wall biosynthesis